jgi:hypothetical protein
VLRTSTTTVRRLVDEGVLPVVPHMGQRIVIPRVAVTNLVASGRSVAPRTRLHVAEQRCPPSWPLPTVGRRRVWEEHGSGHSVIGTWRQECRR